MNDLIAQKEDIDAAVTASRDYMASPEFNELPIRERQLWQRQTVLMAELAQVLAERIALGVSV